MSKNKKNYKKVYNAVTRTTKFMNKKGKLKGKNKKETKILKGCCTHHYYSGKGKLKNDVRIVIINGKKYCRCQICGSIFPTKLFNDDEIKQITGDYRRLIDQAKYIGIETGVDNKTIDYLAQAGGLNANMKKTCKRLRNIVEKNDNIKKKKRNRQNNMGSLGSWSTTR